MPTRLSYICDRVIEAGWLAAVVFTPLYFNVYSSRVFEPDKISFLRNIIALAAIAWIIKIGERVLSSNGERSRLAQVADAVGPAWLPGWLRIPMLLPILLYAAIFLLTTITSVVPLTSIFGSYQRFQGDISQYTYIMLALLIIANMRSRAQLERLLTFGLVTSTIVSLYGLMQALGDDPLPWAGDVQTRVASTMGNAIFVAAYLIMCVPLTLQRLIAALARLRADNFSDAAQPQRDPDDQPWALAIIGSGAIFLVLLIQYAGIMTGNNIDPNQSDFSAGDLVIWVLVLIGCALFGWAANNVAAQALATGRNARRNDGGFSLPPALAVLIPVIQPLVFWIAIGIVGNNRVPDFRQWVVIPGAIFVIYALSFLLTLEGRTTRASAQLQVVGLPLLLAMQVLVIFLSQSRGPQLGLIAGLAVFGFALLLRRRMMRAVLVMGTLAVLFLGFLVVFNLPESPIASWRNVPYIGRLGLISQLDEGTGKVRTLIWGGAINLILSDPVRTVIGWGPEAMYVAYNPFYPPELGRWELRNATPDRSHDVFFDQLVTMGLLGFLGYLFLVGSFLWFAVRALRKAPMLEDQLIAAALLAGVVAHVVELSVGIQIAATYTYFYSMIGCLVAWGYFMTGYLRQAPLAASSALDDTLALAPAANGIADGLPEAESAAVGAAQPARGAARAGAVAASSGRRNVTAAPPPRSGNTANNGGSRRATPIQPGGRVITPQGGRSNSPRGAAVRPVVTTFSNARNNPLAIGIYAALLLVGLLFAVGINVNAVKADMFYKQGLAADQASAWQNAILPYEKAIAISPTEDFYYLFLGRAYLELAKTQGTSDQAVSLLNSAQSALQRANRLNPMNTDHYANLGRLYVYWGDTFSDPSKYQQALTYYAKAHSLAPGNAQIWDEYGVALDKGGQTDAALTALRDSVAMDTSYNVSHFLLGELLRTQSNRYAAQTAGAAPALSATLTLSATTLMQEAGVQYGEAVKIDPTTLQDNSFEQRVTDLIARQAITPVIEGYRYTISYANQYDEAEPVAARSALGYILSKQGDLNGAISEFERAVLLNCGDYYNLRNLGMLYADAGRDTEALNTLQNALSVAECSPTANFCPALRSSVAGGTCQAFANDSSMTSQMTDLRQRIDALKQKLGQQ